MTRPARSIPCRPHRSMFAAFNFANPNQPAGSLWTDLRVRQAASQAINRERYAEEVFGGFTRWQAAGTVAQPWAHDDEATSPAYSPEAASVLLTEAGWIDYDGDGVREDVNGWQLRPVAILRDDSRPELAAVMARVARDLAAVGMALSVEVLPPDAFDERWIARRDYDLIALCLRPAPRVYGFRSLRVGVGHPQQPRRLESGRLCERRRRCRDRRISRRRFGRAPGDRATAPATRRQRRSLRSLARVPG